MEEELEDYTGKLNEHQSYLEMLNKIEKQCKYIEVVIISERELSENDLVTRFKNDIEKVTKVAEWWGTKTFCSNNKVKIKSSKKLFDYLSKFETFCKYHVGKQFVEDWNEYVDVQETTDFGYDDIAFFNEQNTILLCTTTHECYIYVNKKLI